MYIPSVFFQVGECKSLRNSGSITSRNTPSDACAETTLGDWYHGEGTTLDLGTRIYKDACLSQPYTDTGYYRDINYFIYEIDTTGLIVDKQNPCTYQTQGVNIWIDTTNTGSYTTGSGKLYNILPQTSGSESDTWRVGNGVDIVAEESIALTGSFAGSTVNGALYLSGSNLTPDPPGPAYEFPEGTQSMFMLVKSRDGSPTGYEDGYAYSFWNNQGDASGREGINVISRGSIYDGDDQPSERTTFTYDGGVNFDSILPIDFTGSQFTGWQDDYKVLCWQMEGPSSDSRTSMYLRTWHDNYVTKYYMTGSLLGSTRFNKLAQNFGYFKKFVYYDSSSLDLTTIQSIASVLESDYQPSFSSASNATLPVDAPGNTSQIQNTIYDIESGSILQPSIQRVAPSSGSTKAVTNSAVFLTSSTQSSQQTLEVVNQTDDSGSAEITYNVPVVTSPTGSISFLSAFYFNGNPIWSISPSSTQYIVGDITGNPGNDVYGITAKNSSLTIHGGQNNQVLSSPSPLNNPGWNIFQYSYFPDGSRYRVNYNINGSVSGSFLADVGAGAEIDKIQWNYNDDGGNPDSKMSNGSHFAVLDVTLEARTTSSMDTLFTQYNRYGL